MPHVSADGYELLPVRGISHPVDVAEMAGGQWARVEQDGMLRIAGPGQAEDSLAPLSELAYSVEQMHRDGLLSEEYYGPPVPTPGR
jgi:hypothetical protein